MCGTKHRTKSGSSISTRARRAECLGGNPPSTWIAGYEPRLSGIGSTLPVVNERIPVVILCGGSGTRLAEQTEVRPKPLVEIGGRPILWHIMKHYSRYGFNEFVLALGYKGDEIKRYFLDYHALGGDMTISLTNGQVVPLSTAAEPW